VRARFRYPPNAAIVTAPGVYYRYIAVLTFFRVFHCVLRTVKESIGSIQRQAAACLPHPRLSGKGRAIACRVKAVALSCSHNGPRFSGRGRLPPQELGDAHGALHQLVTALRHPAARETYIVLEADAHVAAHQA